MKSIKQSIRGCSDYLPEYMRIWRLLERKIIKVLNSYCYNEIQFPIIENTELFQRTIGLSTDILLKEMYSFKDKKNNSITLRPEGTIGCVRAIIENKLNSITENRLWYVGPMFRYERPQKGRYRQFNQLGIEVFAISEPEIELELLMIFSHLLDDLNLSDSVYLEINSIGSKYTRRLYIKDLVIFLKKYATELDEDSKKRIYTNPLRILDTKNKNIQHLLKEAPIILDYLDEKSKIHFETLCSLMNKFNIKYKINTKLVRGLDYYNDTVFEWKTNVLGSQNTVCGGGRYDTLFQQIGGQSTSAVGCAIGIERLILLIKKESLFLKDVSLFTDIYLFFLKKDIYFIVLKLAENIRKVFPTLKVKIDFLVGNISNKLRKANKSNTTVALIFGKKEIFTKTVLIKNLKNNVQMTVSKKELMHHLKKIFF
ncbi:histidine--tRNA ligase [Buchnera aphidicola]|uniref:histidine--tRNA ligase n=1 Tax=Buchnera aphidicola TaxID=9 RepID=UPI0021CA69E8|nr:histidine--tRNA ligase [Buchnera aphidicola]